MKNIKRILSLLLVLCLVFSLAPFSVFAEEAEEAETDVVVSETEATEAETTPPVETEPDPTVNEEVPTEPTTPAEEEEIPENTEPATEPVSVPASAASADAPSAEDGIASLALNMGTKPENGTTSGQPFINNTTGGSQYFRIPALVTLSNGTLVAAADARWNTTYDGGGLDTIVARSTDNGASWNYTFANYLGDNGNVYNGSQSTAFIDPALAVASDNTIYMLCDLYPYGIALNGNGNTAPYTAVGFDNAGRLLLSADGTNYNYYLEGRSIYSSDGTVVSGYTVDEYFNITGSGYDTNLFFFDSPYKVVRTGYLYLTKSTDGGESWSEPTLISNVKTTSEQVCLVGPGRGLVTTLDNGTERIIFPCYSYNGRDGQTSFIYSDNGGETWTRSASLTSQTSEATLVEVDGKLYAFARHGVAAVSTDYGATWTENSALWPTGVYTGCQIDAITYSKTINGKTAILLSAPTGSSRASGKIFVGLVQDNGSISWDYTYSVNGTNYYAYSCLTELDDGSIGLLYENAAASITYTNIPIANIATGATIGNSTEPAIAEKDVTLYVGQTKTITDESGNYEDNVDRSSLDTDIAMVTVTGTTTQGSTSSGFSMVTSPVSGSSYYISDGEGHYLTLTSRGNNYSLSNTNSQSNATQWKAEKSGDKWRFSATVNGTTRYINYSNNSITAGTTNTYVWFYDATYGIYGSTSASKRLGFNYNNGWTSVTTDSSYGNGAFYADQTVTTPDVNKTDIAIKGIAVGATSVVVGNTKYNITVKELPEYVDAESTPFLVGSGYTGSGNILTKLTLSVGLTYDIDLASGYSGGTWSIDDTSIATVDQNGVVTGVKTGETTLTYTDSNGVVYRIPVVIVQNTTSSSTKKCSLHISEIKDTDVWYSWNCSGSEDEFIQAVNGEAIYVSYESDVDYCINFYGAPHEGYALTFMSATNSLGQYLALDDKTDPTGCDFYTESGAGKNERNNAAFGDEKVAADIQAALNLGCDGAQGFSRAQNDPSNIDCDLTFRSQKLPTVEKTIKTVNGEAYTEGMTATAGDKIVYGVTVTQYATTEAIEYSNVTLTDNLSGAKFSNNRNTVSPSLSNSTLSANQTYSYDVTYTIQDADLDTDIINTVDLNYNYSSTYSSGTFGGSANAEAKISAPSFEPYDIVIDFGLPVTVDYSDNHGRYDILSGTATYGTVSVTSNKVTYTPFTTLKDIDTVTLTNSANGTVTFKVYPATTVYYEEGFATYTDGWTGTTSVNYTDAQATQIAGQSSDEYGYDSAYSNSVNASNDSQAIGNAKGDSAVFSFTGTGVDVYANCNKTTGIAVVQVRDGNGKLVKLATVNTEAVGAYGGKVVANAYNTPIVSINGLPHGDYTVKVIVSSGTINLDGFRVYGTLEDQDIEVYRSVGENDPTFVELRNKVLTALKVDPDNSQYADQIAESIYKQVYDEADGETAGVVIITDTSSFNSDIDVQELLDEGPKNEIYLLPGQTAVFTLPVGSSNQIGLKAVNGAVTYTVSGKQGNQTLTSSTDMFYDICADEDGTNVDNGVVTITIANDGDSAGILSITKLKLCTGDVVVNGNENNALCSLSAKSFLPALMSLGYEIEPDVSVGPENPVETPDDPGTSENPVETPDDPGTSENPVETPDDSGTVQDPVETPDDSGTAQDPVETPDDSGTSKDPAEDPAGSGNTDEQPEAPEAPSKPDKTDELAKPQASTKKPDSSKPNTGDSANLVLWFGLMAAAMAALVVLFTCSTKRVHGKYESRR